MSPSGRRISHIISQACARAATHWAARWGLVEGRRQRGRPGVEVERRVEPMRFVADDNRMTTTLRHANGNKETIDTF